MRAARFLGMFLFLSATTLLSAPVVTVIKDAAGELIFDYTLADPLTYDSLGQPQLVDALADEAKALFYPLCFILPRGARITQAEGSGIAAPLRCVASSAGMVRSAYVAAVRLYPVSGPVGKALVCRQGRVTLRYQALLAKAATTAAADNPFAEKALAGLAANYATSLDRRSADASMAKAATSPYESAKIKFFADRDALYSLSFETIEALGFSAMAIDPVTLRLFSFEGEVPIYLETARKGYFAPGDRILFAGTFEKGTHGNHYPEHTFSKAYYLDWGSAPGLRAPLVNASPRYLDSDGTVHEFDPLYFTAEDRNIRTVSSFWRTIHVEKDENVLRLTSPESVFSSDANPADYEFAMDDYWLWKGMCEPASSLDFQLDATPATSGMARVRVRFLGYTHGPHSVKLYLNNSPLVRAGQAAAADPYIMTWSGQSPMTFESELSLAHLKLLNGGKNTLLVLLEANDCVFVNWIEADYDALPGVVDNRAQILTLDTSVITGRNSYRLSLKNALPGFEVWDIKGRRFTGLTSSSTGLELYDIVESPVTYLVAGNILAVRNPAQKVAAGLRNAGNGADLLIIARSDLVPGLAGFTAHKRAQGLAVYTAPLEAVYDQFGDGSVDPEAVKAFIKYAYESFSPKPFYLLLVGDASEGSDKLSPGRNLLPTFFTQINGWGIASSDSRFTTVSGDDLFPDLAVGRLPGKNIAEIARLLKKSMDAETASDPGPWKNDFLLIGGQEPVFTAANNRYQNSLLGRSFNVRRVDVDTLSPYFFPNNSETEVRNIFNSGAAFVSFYGHGGGSVWSDGKPAVLGHADALALVNAPRLPVVFSLTCLTASFETISFGLDEDLWPPLGETMVLSPQGGASAFYGASGHSFTSADYRLGLALAQATCDSALRRAGDIIFRAEQTLLSAYGTQYFPVVGQYNLLGDPSLRVQRPGRLSVTPARPVLAPGDTLTLYIVSDSLSSGSGTARVYHEDGALSFFQNFTLRGKQDTLRIPFKPGQSLAAATVRVFVWNGQRDEMGTAAFTLDDIAFTGVRPFRVTAAAETLSLEKCAMGDTVFIEAGVLLPAGSRPDTLYVAWAADTAYKDGSRSDTLVNLLPLTQIRPPDSVTPGLYRTASGIPVSVEDFGEVRGLTYCVTAAYTGPDSVHRLKRVYYHLPVAGPPDLAFLKNAKISMTLNGRAVVRTRFLNYGETDAPPFQVRMTAGSAPTVDLPYVQALGARTTDSLDIPLNTNGFFKVTVVLDAPNTVPELDKANNSASAVFGMNGAGFGRLDTLLYSPDSGVAIRPVRSTDTFEVIALTDPIDSLDSARIPVFPAHTGYALASLQRFYRPAGAPTLARYDFTLLGTGTTVPDSCLRLTYRYDSAAAASVVLPRLLDSLGFYEWVPGLGFWKWRVPDIDTLARTVSVTTGLGKRMAPGRCEDFTGPTVLASSAGRALSYQNYIPVNAAIDVQIQDGSAVDTGRVLLLLTGGEPLPRARYALGYAGGTGDVSVSFRPFRQGADSLYVVAWDVNGNRSDTAKFGYQLGAGLSVLSFANHPNPFGRKTIFAFTITDDADRVEMKIFTMAGRMVRRFTLQNVIGYVEVPWDATDDAGAVLSNGVYYLKLTVRNRDKTLEHIYKIAKAEGR
ncbi:MAG: C25 family cysteine peptidase [Fibrobacterota bacterium]